MQVFRDRVHLPVMEISDINAGVKAAYETAAAVFQRNCVDFPPMMIQAGGRYPEVWTRDCAYNTYMAGNLVCSEIAYNTLMRPLQLGGGRMISGLTDPRQPEKYDQYWDKMLWTVAAYDYFQINGNFDFLRQAYEASEATLLELESKHMHPKFQLLQGPAFLCDSIGSLPADICSPELVREPYSNVMDYDLPHRIMTLSSNAILVGAYRCMAGMARLLVTGRQTEYAEKAQRLSNQINRLFWNEKTGLYDFFIYGYPPKEGLSCQAQESAGLAFAILFDVADEAKARSIFQSVHTEPWGITLSWPSFDNHYIGNAKFYQEATGYDTPQNVAIWPNVNGLWARACAMRGNSAGFCAELNRLTRLIERSCGTIYEIYHALTGNPGLKYHETKPDQTWSATAYLNMILCGVLGLRMTQDEVRFSPYLPAGWGDTTFSNVPMKGKRLDVRLTGEGSLVKEFRVDGCIATDNAVPADGKDHQIVITLER